MPTSKSAWDDFLTAFSRYVDLPDELNRSTTIRQVFGSDRVKRSLLSAALRMTLNDPPQDLLDSIETMGDASDWFEVRRHNPPEEHSPRSVAETTVGRSVRLRTVRDSDIPYLYQAAIDPRWSFKWRYRGSVPSLAEFQAGLYQGTLTQFVVELKEANSLVGWVAAYNTRHDNGTAYIALARATDPKSSVHSEMIEGVYLFVNYLFATWPFRKLYAEIAGFGWHQFEWGEGRMFEIEGVLIDHDYHDGEFWDQRLVAIHRDWWSRARREHLDRLFQPSNEPGLLLQDATDLLGVANTHDVDGIEGNVH